MNNYGGSPELRACLSIGLTLTAMLSGLCARADQQGEDLADALQAGIEEWRQTIEFVGRYRYRQAMADSKEDALSGRFGKVVGKPEDVVVGMIAKKGSDMRWSVEFDRPPVKQGASKEATNVSFDAATVGNLQVNYFPKRGSFGNSATVSVRPEETEDLIQAGQFNRDVPNPFSFNGGTDGKPFERFMARPGYGEKLRIEVLPPKSDAIGLSFIRVGDDGHKIVSAVRFTTEYSPPVIESISVRIEFRSEITESSMIASQFVQCNGGAIATHLRQVQGPVTVANSRTKKWIAREWISADLGVREPTNQDFVLTIPAGVSIRGLKKPPLRDKPFELDLRALTEDDLYAGPLELGDVQFEDRPASNLFPRLLWTGLGTIAVGLLLFIFWRRRS